MYQGQELNVEEKSNANVNKSLYKLLIIILRYTPIVLSINDVLHSILSYYDITLLQKFIDDIDADNCNITMEQQSKIISVLSNIANPDQRMSKIQACDYIGVSRATFDNYVKDGFIPKGIKQEGFKELSWNKADLDIFLSSQK